VRITSLPDASGFALPCNLGARDVEGDLLLFANDDLWFSRDWLARVISALPSSGGAVAGLVLNADGTAIDYAGGAINLFGYGINRLNGRPISEASDPGEPVPTFFPPGSAFLIDRSAFERAGAFDADFGAFFEDVDLGWRLWLSGYRVNFVASAVSFHSGGLSTASRGIPWKHFLLQRNSLLAVFKNYSDEVLEQILPLALQAAAAKSRWLASSGRFRLALAHLRAVASFRSLHPANLRKRQEVQACRIRSDKEMIALFGEPLQSAFFNELPRRLLSRAAQRLSALGIPIPGTSDPAESKESQNLRRSTAIRMEREDQP
jgi:GT2 family glycosyltransferase